MMLTIDHLSFSFGPAQVLSNFSLELAPGQIGTLIGSSGSGKTTVFRLLTGLLNIQQGRIAIAGKQTPDAYSCASFMMQEDLLLPWRTIIDNLLIVGELGKRKPCRDKLRREAQFYLSEMGLKGWEEAYPEHLSGGMKQRVSLARALMQKRPVLLLDEPFSNLDVGLREQMLRLLQEIRRKYGTTILMITHDFRDAISLSDKIFLLSEGKIEREWKLEKSTLDDPLAFHRLHGELLSAIRA